MYQLPEHLPVPDDDGACDHLPGLRLPQLLLPSTSGRAIDLSSLPDRTVIYFYPRTGRPEEEDSTEWDAIPGARGCTPQSCGFRDAYEELKGLGTEVFGISTQTTGYQDEAVARLQLPYPLLSDADLLLTNALRLPTFQFKPYGDESAIHLKRIAIVIRDGLIEKVFYPVFPPDENARVVREWLASHQG